jgi:hypothetical protein
MKYLNEKKFDPSKSDRFPLGYQYGIDLTKTNTLPRGYLHGI